MKRNDLKISLLLPTILIVFVMLQSCTVAAPAIPTEPIKFRKENAKNGLIIGTVTFPHEKAQYNGYFIRIMSKEKDEKTAKKHSTEIHISPKQIVRMRHKGQIDNGLTYLFAIERPEGNYEISSIRLFINYGYFTKTWLIEGFSIPFHVKKGEITYVGNLFFDESMGNTDKNIDEIIKLESNFEKDIKAFQKIQPYTDWRMVIDREDYFISYD